MKCIRLLLFLLSFSLFADAQVLELLNRQENLLLDLKGFEQSKNQEIVNLRNSLNQSEQGIESWKIYFQEYEKKTSETLKRKDSELQKKESLLAASNLSLVESQKLQKNSLKSIDSLETTLNLWKFWNKISISVLIALALAVVVETIIIIKKK